MIGKKDQKVMYTQLQCLRNLAAIEDALYVLGGKWKLRVVIALVSGYNRFNEIQRTISGISARVLSNELKDLEINGLVERIVHADQKPVVVEYVATEYAQSLGDIIAALTDWGHEHKKKITGNGALEVN